MDTRFEKGTMADVDAVMENIRAVRVNGSADWDEEYPALTHITDDVENDALYILRARDGSVAASVAVYYDDAEFEDDCASVNWMKADHNIGIFRLCVSAQSQGKGLGFLLITHVLDMARARGCQTARLLASEQNEAANRLYRKLNFRSLGRHWLFEWWFIAYEKEL